jgi:hypothetical protein
MEVGVIETGTAGAQSVESVLPLVLTLVGISLLAAGLAVSVSLLRPRLARRLTGAGPVSTAPEQRAPASRPTVVPASPQPAAAQEGRSAA